MSRPVDGPEGEESSWGAWDEQSEREKGCTGLSGGPVASPSLPSCGLARMIVSEADVRNNLEIGCMIGHIVT